MVKHGKMKWYGRGSTKDTNILAGEWGSVTHTHGTQGWGPHGNPTKGEDKR